MTHEEYLEKCETLAAKAKEKGVELDFNPQDYDEKHLHCLWNSGWFAEIKLDEHFSIALTIYGDVRATLFDSNDNEIASVRDEQNAGWFRKEMEDHIKDDDQLAFFMLDGSLVLDNNNWVEYSGIYYKNPDDQTGITIDIGVYEDTLLDNNILKAIDQVLDDLDTIKDQIKKYANISEK